MRTGLVIPSLGAPPLEHCLEAAGALYPAPEETVVVLSGGATAPAQTETVSIRRCDQRLGFAAAVNRGIATLADGIEAVAILNDDAVPETGWLGALVGALVPEPDLAAVQGTVIEAGGTSIDGRGIVFDRWGLPVQVDRGLPIDDDTGERPVIAVSGTACLYRMDALRQAALSDSEIFDLRFDCYHEDLDLGLRLHRLGRSSKWIGGARTVHLGSASGPTLRWRHPWWLLANRWRALSGNLSPFAFLATTPRLLRGEIRAVRTLSRNNWRALPTAAAVACIAPLLAAGGWLRKTSGPRLEAIPDIPA
jgi:GT2 family glycosyltransferase